MILEVKRADTYPWKQNVSLIPNKQAVNSAEKQLKKDLDLLQALLVGVPPSQVLFTTLPCFPDVSSAELQTVICASCLDFFYITNLLRLNRKWITYNRGSNDNFKFSWINYFPTCHNGFRKRLLSIDVRFPSINAKQAIGNIVNMIRKQD